MISFTIIDKSNREQTIEAPDDMNLSLMEVLKASGFDIPATCGGIALCATCHVDVVEGSALLSEPGDAELDMIDTLPNATGSSRLACQIRIASNVSDAVFRLAGSGDQ